MLLELRNYEITDLPFSLPVVWASRATRNAGSTRRRPVCLLAFDLNQGGITHRGSHQKESTARQPSCTTKPLLGALGSTLERRSTRKIPPKPQNAARGVVLMCARAAGWAAAAARRPPATRHSLEATSNNKKSAAGYRHACGTVAAVVVQAERVMPEAKSTVSHRARARSIDLTSRTQHKPDRPVRRGGWEAPARAPAAPFLSSVVFSSV